MNWELSLIRPTHLKLVVSALFLGVFLMSAYAQQKSPSRAAALAVKVLAEPVVSASSATVFDAVGTGRATQSINLYPAVEETVTGIYFKSQQKVKARALLVQLENREETLALQLAQVQLKNAKSLLARYQQAVAQGAVPQTQVDEAQADLEAAEVAVERAKLALADRQIRAPFAGVVGIPLVDLGQRVGTDVLITGMDSREMIDVDIEIPEVLSAIAGQEKTKGAALTALSPAFPDKTFPAQIAAVESRLNAERRTLKMRVRIDNKNDMLRPGMSFTIRWQVPGRELPSVPDVALQWSREGSYVWVVRGNKTERVFARVVDRRDGKVLLEGPLKPQDLVVVEGVQRVRSGTLVEVLKGQPQ